MANPFSKLHGLDSKAAGEVIVSTVDEVVIEGTDTFLVDYTTLLTRQLTTLSQCLAQSKQQELTAEASLLHIDLKQTYSDFRQVLRVKSKVKSLQTEAEASTTLFDTLERHGGALDKLPRHAMISALVNVITEIDAIVNNTLDNAQVAIIYNSLKALHTELQEKEELRNEIALQEESIPNEAEASRLTNNTVRSLYRHISDYASIDKRGYSDLLAEIDRRLSPIFVHIKTQETRHKNEVEESVLEFSTEESEDSINESALDLLN